MTEATTQVKIGASLDGTFETTAKTGKRLINEIGTAARDAGKNTGEIGNGLSASAQKVEAATRNMIGSIQRQTAAMEAGTKAGRAYQESLAKMRGIDVAALKPYLDHLDAVKVKQDASAASMAALRSVGVAAGYALAAAATGLAAFTKSSIDAADAMNDMSQRVGIAVGDLAKYQLAAEQSGTSMEAISKGVKGLAGNLIEHGTALKKAGIDATNADGAMQQLADVFSSMPDGIEKTTLATKLFGKAGMDLIPMLNLGSKGLATAAEKSAEFAVQMAALAPLADAFNDNMAELAMSSKTIGMTMANQLMPTLIALSGEMIDSKNGANSLAEAMGKGLNTAIEASVVLFSDVAFVMKATGREMGALAAQYVAFMSLDFKGFSAIGDAVKFDAAKARAELDAFQSRVLSARSIASQSVVGTYAQRSGVGYKAPADAAALLAITGAAEKAGKAAKSAADEYGKFNAEIAKSAELAADQLSSGGALADSDKYRIEMLEKLTGAYTNGKITLSQYIDLEAKMTDVESAKRQKEELLAALKISEERAALRKKEYEDAAAFSLAQTDLYNAQVKGAEEALAAAQAEYAQYGLSKAQIAEITLLTLQSTQAKYQDGSEGYAAVQKQIDAQRALIGVLKNTEGLEAAKAANDEWARTSIGIRDNLTDAFTDAVMDGENKFLSLRDTVEKMFESMVIKPIIQAGVSTAMDAVGLGSTASTASGIMGMANTGSSLLSAGSTVSSMGSLLGSSSMGTLDIAGVSMAGVGEALAAIPVWGWVAAGVLALLSTAGNDRLPSQGTGEGQLSFDATGAVTDSYSRFGEGDSNLGLTAAVSDTITALYTDYAKAAASLGIQMVDTQFSFGANTGLEGQDPQFAIGSNAGGVGFSSGEIQQTDEAIQLAASRAVFNALQQSELPKYLAGAFDGISASTATQEQITAALDGASALQSFHNQLQLLPWDGLKDMTYATTQALVDMSGGLDALQSGLGTFYENFYTDAAKTEALTTNTAAAFAALGITMPAVDEGMRDWYRTLVESVLALDQSDAANAGATVAVLSLQTAVDSLAPAFDNTTQSVTDAAAAMQEWQDKLDVATGKTTERAQQLAKDLADAADDQTRSLINQVYAAEDAAVAAQDAADAMKSLTDAIQSMADDTANIIASMADIGKTDFQKSIAQIKRDGDTNQASLDALVIPAATAAATAAVAATSVTTYSGASYAYTVPAAQNDGSMGGFTAEQNASIKAYVAGLDWSAEGTAASSAALLNAMTEVGVSLEHMSNLGYSTTDLKNVASFATAQINNDYAAANPTMAYMGSNYSNWGGPAADAWSSSSYGYGSGGSATGGTSSGGAASSSIAASAAENTAAKINAAYAEQLQSMIDAYKPDTQAVDAVAALTAAGFLIDGLDASGIKKYFYDIASAADPLTETGKATIDALDALSGQIGLLGQVAADRQTWQNKLDVLTGATTDQALQRQADLASTTDVATLAIIKQVHAQEDIAAAQVEIARQQAEALEALAKAADLLNDKLALQATLYELTGNKALSTATLAAQRAIELDSLDASLRDLTSQIWAAQDAISSMDTAMGAVERAVNAQRTSISDGASAQIDAIRASADANKASIDVAQKSVDSLKGIFDDITSAVKTLRGNVDPVTSMLQARSYIDMSLSLADAGVMPNADKLKDALGVVTKDSADTYSSGAEFRFAQLAQAGKLDKLNAIVGVQKTTAEQQLESLNNLNTAAADQIKAIEDARDAQLKMLDAQLKEAQDAISVMKGIDISVLSVSEAIKALNAAINGVSGATGNPAVPVSDRTITPGGGGSSGSGNSYTSPYGGSLANNYNATTSFNGHSMQGLGIDINVLTGSTGNAKNLGNVDMLYSAAQNLGWTSADISNAYSHIGYNITQAEILQRAAEQGIPAFAVGTNYVPYDMFAKIHEGEEIVPKAWNPAAGGRGGQNPDRLERLVEGLTKEVQRLQTIVNDGNKQTKRVADNIDNVTEGGNAMRTRTA